MTNEIVTQNQAAIAMQKGNNVADVCRELVNKTAVSIQNNRYVKVEGWQSIATAATFIPKLFNSLDSLILSQYLDEYAETGHEYVKILRKIIEQNKLKDFDNAKLLPSSLELESLI